MAWLLAAVGTAALALVARWVAAALWVRFISDRWSEFDADD